MQPNEVYDTIEMALLERKDRAVNAMSMNTDINRRLIYPKIVAIDAALEWLRAQRAPEREQDTVQWQPVEDMTGKLAIDGLPLYYLRREDGDLIYLSDLWFKLPIGHTVCRQMPIAAPQTQDAIPFNALDYIIDNIQWDYNSPLGEAAYVVRRWLLNHGRPAEKEES